MHRREFIRLTTFGLAAPLLVGAASSTASRSAAAAITPTPTITPLPPASKSMRGLYAVMNRNNDAIPADALLSPLIAGITLQFDWNILQPSPNGFAWDILDGAIQRAANANKKIALRPLAGTGSPAWLYKAGIKKYTFTPISDLWHPLGFGQEVSMPYPWDKKMLDFWTAFVQTLGARYDGEPALARVAVSGPTFEQAETFLPHTDTLLADWVKAGYSLTTIQAAWQRVIDSYASVFMKTPFTLDLDPLPDPTDKAGLTMNGLVPVAIGQYGLKRYPGRFFPAQSDLSDVYPWLPVPLPGPAKQPALYESYEKQAVQVYQFLASAAKSSKFGVLISEPKMSHTATRIKSVMDRAKLLRAAYVEVPVAWVLDAANADALGSLFATPAG